MEKPLRAHCSISPEIMVVCRGYWGRGLTGVIGKKYIYEVVYISFMNFYYYLLNADFHKASDISFLSEN